MMVPLVLATLLAARPASCPADLLVANPRLRVVRASDRTRDNYVVSVDVMNRGTAAQPNDTRQHLELVLDGSAIGSQPVPALGPAQHYTAAFRVQLPHEKKRGPFPVEFRYVLDSKNAPRANCTSVNDHLTATL